MRSTPSSVAPLLLVAAILATATARAQIQRLDLRLPTDNDALLEGRPEDYFMFVDRSVDGVATTPWEAGQFGYVRDPKRLNDGQTMFSRFHEGLDIKAVHRDSRGEPLDEVRSIARGEVVHATSNQGNGGYGRYIVVKHDWGYGPFYSLYAHLREIKVEPGRKVEAGELLGILGYSGRGIDRRRAHVHVELNMLFSSRFTVWHDANFKTPNLNGIYNGLNLTGLDLAALFIEHQKDPAITVAGVIAAAEPFFRVAVPGTAEMELLKDHPWLCTDPLTEAKPPSWEIAFTAWGLPVSVKPGTAAVAQPVLTWIKPSTLPYYYPTRGCVTGTEGKATLTPEGVGYAQLVSGAF